MEKQRIFDRTIFDNGNTLKISVVKNFVNLSKILSNQNAVSINAQKR